MDQQLHGQFALKKIGIKDKMVNAMKKLLGYRDGSKFILDIKPNLREYSEIELMKIASIEEKLRKVLKANENELVDGIEENEARALLEWTVQNGRDGIMDGDDKKAILNDSLLGACGLGQGITAFTLKNMGLDPNAVNATKVLSKNGFKHAFLGVTIPVKGKDGVENKPYLVDITFKQFFLRTQITNHNGEFVKDKKFGNKVAPIPGYWMLHLPNGEKVAQEILSEGFIELTEENAKIYGDSFELANRDRKNPEKIPSKAETKTGISGQQYLTNIMNKELQSEIDYTEQELSATYGINIRTPLMIKESRVKQEENSPDIEQSRTQEKSDREIEI